MTFINNCRILNVILFVLSCAALSTSAPFFYPKRDIKGTIAIISETDFCTAIGREMDVCQTVPGYWVTLTQATSTLDESEPENQEPPNYLGTFDTLTVAFTPEMLGDYKVGQTISIENWNGMADEFSRRSNAEKISIITTSIHLIKQPLAKNSATTIFWHDGNLLYIADSKIRYLDGRSFRLLK